MDRLDAYWRAQARIGTEVARAAYEDWQSVNPFALRQSSQGWLSRTLERIGLARRRSRRLAIVFYALHRAEETGYAPSLPDGMVQHEVSSLGELREMFAQEADIMRIPEEDDNELVEVEDFDWPDDNFVDDNNHYDRTSVADLVSTGPARAYALTEEYRGRLDDPDFLESLQSAGRGAAQSADRQTVAAGRDLIETAGNGDRRLRGYARITDGNPCGFCAMLAARGAVYRSRQRAELGGRKKPEGSADARNPKNKRPPVGLADLSKYHNGCHCQVIPVYTDEPFLTPESRRLAGEWQKVAGKLSGEDARRAWRRHIESNR